MAGTSYGGRLRWVCSATALTAAALLLTATPALAVPGQFWGVVPQGHLPVEQLQRVKAGGVDSIRVPISWASTQPTPDGAWNWSDSDGFIAAAAAARFEILPFLSTAPPWAVNADPRLGSPRHLPVRTGRQRSGWSRFVKEAVRRYGPRGSFWAANPGLPRKPLRVWQIWNEPNFKYFVARPNPAEYGRLVKFSAAAVKSADPGAKVLLGGLFARPIEATHKVRPPQAYFAADFLDQMYKRTPGIKSTFQGVSLHPYTGSWRKVPSRIEEVRRVLKRHGDIGKGLWMTEMTWSSEPPQRHNSFAKGVQGQVRELNGAFRLFERNWRRWRIKRIYWFSINDYAGLCNFCGGSGLFGEGFKPKPAWYTYVKFAGGHP